MWQMHRQIWPICAESAVKPNQPTSTDKFTSVSRGSMLMLITGHFRHRSFASRMIGNKSWALKAQDNWWTVLAWRHSCQNTPVHTLHSGAPPRTGCIVGVFWQLWDHTSTELRGNITDHILTDVFIFYQFQLWYNRPQVTCSTGQQWDIYISQSIYSQALGTDCPYTTSYEFGKNWCCSPLSAFVCIGSYTSPFADHIQNNSYGHLFL